MTLPLFDGPPSRQARPVSLVRLAGEIARAAGGIGVVSVEGEAHRPTVSRGGWVFFTLRDRAAQVQVVVPRAVAGKARIVAGERVAVVGALEWTAERGQLALRASEVSPIGDGAIAALLAQTRARLGSDGLLDRPRRPLPVLPSCIGVVCGADAAVRRDIESVVADRFPGYPLHIVESTVSGPGAPYSIVEALRRAASHPAVEVVIVARGGGDATALLPWSDEDVCRAVAACPVPVVSAIGHDGDRPLCDEVADFRAGTPSIAAHAVVPDRAALSAQVEGLLASSARLLDAHLDRAGRAVAGIAPARSLDSALRSASAALDAGGRRLVDAHPRRRLDDCRRRLAAADWRRPAGEILGRASGRLEAGGRHLAALDPARVLERGYAVVTGPDGAVVRRATSVVAGDHLDIRVAAGRIDARVEAVDAGG